jgi:hypothetical protein
MRDLPVADAVLLTEFQIGRDLEDSAGRFARRECSAVHHDARAHQEWFTRLEVLLWSCPAWCRRRSRLAAGAWAWNPYE